MENGNVNGNGKMVMAMSMESLNNDNCSTVSSLNEQSQVRTLFISGLPMDTRARELYLLFRSCSGYEASQLKVTNKNGKTSTPVGFVTFSTHQDANEARRKLQGVRFDPESSQTIRLELARSNTKVTSQKSNSNSSNQKGPTQPSPPILAGLPTPGGMSAAAMMPVAGAYSQPSSAAAFAAAMQVAAAAHQAQEGSLGLGLDHQHLAFLTANGQGQQADAGQNQMFQHLAAAQQYSAALQMLNTPVSVNQQLAAAMAQIQQQQQVAAMANYGLSHGLTVAASGMQPNNGLMVGIAQQPQLAGPCSTLFVANLGAQPQEEELRQLFKSFAGFSRLRMHHKGGSPVAFVEFAAVQQAAVALSALQGFQLTTSERGSGIRIEFARSKMGDVSTATAAHTNGGYKEA
uniref:RRM domain-containing protein n=1 Tax=Ditylenchus dipsaci TaxID=166011 RepID=A0A915EIF0_9BILA